MNYHMELTFQRKRMRAQRRKQEILFQREIKANPHSLQSFSYRLRIALQNVVKQIIKLLKPALEAYQKLHQKRIKEMMEARP